MRKNQAAQAGFTLVELVMVIVIIGILAAVAMPKFIDLSSQAGQSAVSGVAGSLSSASAVNYAARKADSTKGAAVSDCSAVSGLLQAGAMPAGFTITPSAIAADTTNTLCVVTATATAASAAFTATGIN